MHSIVINFLYLLCNTEKSATCRCVQRRPPLIVSAIDVRAPGHQKLDHLEVVVDTRLEIKSENRMTKPDSCGKGVKRQQS